MCDLDVDFYIRIQAAKDLGYLLRLPHPVRLPFVPQRYQQCDFLDKHKHNHDLKVMYDKYKEINKRMDEEDELMEVGLGDYKTQRALKGYTKLE